MTARAKTLRSGCSRSKDAALTLVGKSKNCAKAAEE
jgi:hypothetical protein